MSKNAATMDGRRQRTLKLHWLKRLKTVPKKQSLYQKNKWYAENLICGVYLLVLDFQSQQKVAKKSLSFYNTVSLKKPHSFYERQQWVNIKINVNIRTSTLKKDTPVTQPKTLITLQIFQQTCFWLVS